jgi:hypothetical protein
MDQHALAEEYRHRTDDELLRLLSDQQDLTAEARVALRSEMASRNLSDRDISEFLEEERQANLQEERDAEHGKLQRIKYRYLHYGKADREYDPATNLERYSTTFYNAILLFPLIPMGTYRVERRRSWLGRITILKKLPLDWEQVLKSWIVAAASLLILIWIWKLINHFWLHL